MGEGAKNRRKGHNRRSPAGLRGKNDMATENQPEKEGPKQKKEPLVKRSSESGAENGARTRDLNLGKVTLYQLSYFRERDCKYTAKFVIRKFF